MNQFQLKAIEETNRYYDIARKLYKQFDRQNPTVDFRLRGATAGMAWYSTNRIQYQPKLLEQNFEEFIARTVPHEVAHIVAYDIYGTAGHDENWRHVMKLFKVDDISRCHSYDVSTIRKSVAYSCSCKVYQLTMIRHNKVQKGTQTYTCRLCKNILKKV